VHVSHQHVVAQIINDDTGKTLAYATTAGQKASTGSLGEKAAAVGEDIGKKAKSAKVKTVVLDRGSKLYHGRVAALADAARKAGLEF
jgi:large subunit ribosomal protein L18